MVAYEHDAADILAIELNIHYGDSEIVRILPQSSILEHAEPYFPTVTHLTHMRKAL